jgi:hypothetical protein
METPLTEARVFYVIQYRSVATGGPWYDLRSYRDAVGVREIALATARKFALDAPESKYRVVLTVQTHTVIDQD